MYPECESNGLYVLVVATEMLDVPMLPQVYRYRMGQGEENRLYRVVLVVLSKGRSRVVLM